MKQSNFWLWICGICTLLGIGCLLGAIGTTLYAAASRKSAVPVTAVISRIETYEDPDGKERHSVYVDYTFEDEEFKDYPLNYYSSNMYEGKEITLYRNSREQGKPRPMAIAAAVSVVLWIFGIVYSLIGIIPTIVLLKRRMYRKELSKSGRALYAQVDRIELSRGYTINKRRPYSLYCHYTDPYSNATYEFKRHFLLEDPSPYLPVGSMVEVIVMNGDYSVYQVNVEKAKELQGRR